MSHGQYLSAELPDGMVAVRYVFTVGTRKPVSGESFCHMGKDCSLGPDSDPVVVTLRLEETEYKDLLSVTCTGLADDCTLLDGLRAPADLDAVGVRAYFIDERLRSDELMIRGPRRFGRFFIPIRAKRQMSRGSAIKAL